MGPINLINIKEHCNDFYTVYYRSTVVGHVTRNARGVTVLLAPFVLLPPILFHTDSLSFLDASVLFKLRSRRP